MADRPYMGLLCLGALLVLPLLCGCGGIPNAYLAAGHDPAKSASILVLPFLDARTFRAKNDPLKDKVNEEGREIFVAALKKHPLFKDKRIITPAFERMGDSLTAEQALLHGFEHNADLVVAGQIFSYTGTRAASIAPRAGMFVRIFSVPEDRLVYVGDHYRAGAGPGSRGGRRRQAEIVADSIVNAYGMQKARRPETPTATVVKDQPGDTVQVLFLPYHELGNPRNLIEKTGGGSVATSLYKMELAKLGSYHLIAPISEAVSYNRLLSVEDALSMGRQLEADYVVRGQVVEFRRARSVPSLYSALISVSILIAQTVFAEISGVDIATEVWRVEDGKCIFAKRDIRRQKYVVQAERTVRLMAAATVPELASAIANPRRVNGKGVIDSIVVPKIVQHRRTARSGKKKGPGSGKEAPSSEVAGTDTKKGEAGKVDKTDAAEATGETEKRAVEDKAAADKAAAEDTDVSPTEEPSGGEGKSNEPVGKLEVKSPAAPPSQNTGTKGETASPSEESSEAAGSEDLQTSETSEESPEKPPAKSEEGAGKSSPESEKKDAGDSARPASDKEQGAAGPPRTPNSPRPVKSVHKEVPVPTPATVRRDRRHPFADAMEGTDY